MILVHFSDEMRQQLYVLQTLLLNQLEDRMNTVVESQDQKALEKIKELRKIAFEVRDGPSGGGGGHQQRTRFSEDYKKLGFRNEIDPTQDFR